MGRLLTVALALWTALLTAPVCAGEGIAVSDAWTRASAPGQKVAGVYFRITSSFEARLVGVETALTRVSELHYMTMDEGVMRMRQVASVDLPAGKAVSFKPGGYHVMLFDLQEPLKAGEQIAIDLLVEDEGGEQSRVPVTVDVRNLDGSKAEQHHHH